MTKFLAFTLLGFSNIFKTVKNSCDDIKNSLFFFGSFDTKKKVTQNKGKKMSFSISQNDIIWSRTGDPVRVTKRDHQNGKVYLDGDFSAIQELASKGIRNGLEPEQREAYQLILSDIIAEDAKEEIQNLHHRIEDLKNQNVDSRFLKYLENELQYRMVREKFVPEDFGVDAIVLGV
jgi:hypothetical protein